MIRTGSTSAVMCVALAVGSFAFWGASAGALSSHEVAPAQVAIPTAPAATASLATWQAWSIKEQAVMSKINWARQMSNSTCQVQHTTVTKNVSSGNAGIPAGIITDQINLFGTCSLESSKSPVTSLSSRNCPVQSYGSAANVDGGVACVGVYSTDGTNYMASSYVRTAGGSTYGHPELGALSPWASNCYSGATLANGHPEVNVPTGSYSAVVWGPKLSSGNWAATWWQDNQDGTYSNFGSSCGSF